jgi:hypothetical protein
MPVQRLPTSIVVTRPHHREAGHRRAVRLATVLLVIWVGALGLVDSRRLPESQADSAPAASIGARSDAMAVPRTVTLDAGRSTWEAAPAPHVHAAPGGVQAPVASAVASPAEPREPRPPSGAPASAGYDATAPPRLDLA